MRDGVKSDRGRQPCIVGVATRTYRGLDAPEPLDMWVEVLRSAADDAGAPRALAHVDSLATTYCQTWQYDDPLARLTAELHIEPRHTRYMSIGGTSGQQLVNDAAERILRGETDVVAIASAEALATQRAARRRGERRTYRFKPEEKRPFPFEAPLHGGELAHDLMSALNAFALFDSARRAHRGIGLDDYRAQLAAMLSGLTRVAATNPDAWFPLERSADDIATPRADNRMSAYPYTKYMAAVMDVDMAAALIVMSNDAADRLGVPNDRRVNVRGWCFAKDPTYIAEHRALHHSPAMRAASQEALRIAGTSVDEVAHFDLYSCFGASLNFACDALGIDPLDGRGLTVTGGLPYHGGPASGYMTHAIAALVRRLRDDTDAYGLTSGVGMINTKHVFGVYSAKPGHLEPPGEVAIQAALDANGVAPVADSSVATEQPTTSATIAAYTVVHDRDQRPRSAPVVVDLADGRRAYAAVLDPDVLEQIEREEFVGASVTLEPHSFVGPAGPMPGLRARLR